MQSLKCMFYPKFHCFYSRPLAGLMIDGGALTCVLSCREALYEDETFPERELAALVASKVYYHLQEYNESMVFALGAGKLLNLDKGGEFEQTIICRTHLLALATCIYLTLLQPNVSTHSYRYPPVAVRQLVKFRCLSTQPFLPRMALRTHLPA